jgi:hypothetical protein
VRSTEAGFGRDFQWAHSTAQFFATYPARPINFNQSFKVIRFSDSVVTSDQKLGYVANIY